MARKVRRSRLALAVARWGRCQRHVRRSAIASATAPDVLDAEVSSDSHASPDPLHAAGVAVEDKIWKGEWIDLALAALWRSSADASAFKDFADKLIKYITYCYSRLSTMSQLRMLTSSLVKHNVTLHDSDDDLGDPLDEPLNLRKLRSPPGFRAFAVDFFVWQEVRDKVPPRASKSKGFATSKEKASFKRAMGLLNTLDENEVLSRWNLIIDVANLFYYAGPPRRTPRIVMPSTFLKRVQALDKALINEDALSRCRVVEYEGAKPSRDLLVSTEHSVVLLIGEGRMPADKMSWSLPVTPSGAPSGAEWIAPIVVFNVAEHSVNFRIGQMCKKLEPIFQNVLRQRDKGLDRQNDAGGNEFLPSLLQNLKPMVSGWVSDFNHRSDTLRSAIEEMRVAVGPMVRKSYSAQWAKIRGERMQELLKAQKEYNAALEKRRQRAKHLRETRASLEDAVERLDLALFQQRAQNAVQTQVGVSEAELANFSKQLADRVEAAEEPFRRLVAQQCDESPPGDTHADIFVASASSLSALEGELAVSRLPTRNTWRAAGEDLQLVLLAVVRLGAALDSVDRSKGAALASELEEALERCRRFAVRFENSVRKLRGSWPESATTIHRALVVGRAALDAARRDEAFQEALHGEPWSRAAFTLGSSNARALAALDAAAARASPQARAASAPTLDAALTMGRCDVALQDAMQGACPDKLASCIDEARVVGLRGLDPAEERLRKLRAAVAELLSELEEATASLDLPRFENALVKAKRRRIALPEVERTRFRETLVSNLAQAEDYLREVLLRVPLGPEAMHSLREAMDASNLPPNNVWRGLAAAICATRDCTSSMRAALDSWKGATELEVLLADSDEACTRLEEQLRRTSAVDCALAAQAKEFLGEASTDCRVRLAGLKGDALLEEALGTFPWGPLPPSLKEISARNVEDLESTAAEATPQGRDRLAEPLQVALDAARCALGLQEAMKKGGETLQRLDILAQRLGEARRRGLRGLESAEQLERELQRNLSASESSANPALGFYGPLALGQAKCSNLIFLDLELTAGFYDFDQAPDILEAAIIITDSELQEKGRGCWVVGGFSQEALDSLGDFHQAHFRDPFPGGAFPPVPNSLGGNGLFSDVLASKLTKEQVEDAILELVQKHCLEGTCPLAGYSVQCDREVLKTEMPRLYRYVSHRIVDVSSFYQMANFWLPEKLLPRLDRRPLHYDHRALNDAEHSIEALRWVREHLFCA